MNTTRIAITLLAAMLFIGLPAPAETPPQRFEAADSKGVQATRSDGAVYLRIDADVKGPVTIPRLAAPLRSMHWEGQEDDGGVQLKPEPDAWVISWKDRPEGAQALVLEFDAEPLLISELKPISVTADGSFNLPAHLATTFGEKIRYEPQPFKNTVGYWAGKQDSATWTIQLDKPGRFNVAVLQGCGRGQGGSKAILIGQHVETKQPVASLRFVVEETGHFQDFQWRHLGTVEFDVTGETRIKVMPIGIEKAALMDIRAVHLIRLPDQKK